MVGTVLDSTGAAVPSATVTARQAQTGKTTSVVSNATGSYVFPSLPPQNIPSLFPHRAFRITNRLELFCRPINPPPLTSPFTWEAALRQ
jgi:hypothetical protein